MEQDQIQALKEKLDAANPILEQLGMNRLAIVRPEDCIPQKKNARYMDMQTFRTLKANLTKFGMESVPLVCESEPGRYEIISGHHRVEAAKAAGVSWIIVMVTVVASHEDLVTRQLAHNALAGKDDPGTLLELFQSIKDIELKISTGLQDQLGKLNFTALTFKVGEFKEFTVLFLPEQLDQVDAQLEKLADSYPVKSSQTVRVASLEYYDRFARAIRKVKRVENVKSTATALVRLVELAEEALARRTTE